MLLVLGLRDRQALDVVAAAGEQTSNACQHARFVVDQNGQRVRLGLFLALVEKIGRTRLGIGHGISFCRDRHFKPMRATLRLPFAKLACAPAEVAAAYTSTLPSLPIALSISSSVTSSPSSIS